MTPPPVFIRPTVSSTHNSRHSTYRNHNHRTTYRQTRNNGVSELFLAEAKAAQAKLEMEMLDGNTSLDTTTTTTTTTINTTTDTNESNINFHTYGVMIDHRPTPLSRQHSSSSTDAVGPVNHNNNNNAHTSNKQQFITRQVPDENVPIATTTTTSNVPRTQLQHNYQSQSEQPHVPKSSQVQHFAITDDDFEAVENDDDTHHHARHHQYRSYRKPLGLVYALRRTDSGSTFQSLDGLSHSHLPKIIRHHESSSSSSSSKPANQKQPHQRSSNSRHHHKSKRKKRSTSSTISSSSSSFTSTIQSMSFMKCYPTIRSSSGSTHDDSDHRRFMCFTTPPCLPVDQIKESFDDYRHRYFASTAYQNQHQHRSSDASIDVNTLDYTDHSKTNNSPSKQREGPERSPSPTSINVPQQHQEHIQEQRQPHKIEEYYDFPEISTTVVVSPTIDVPRRNKQKSTKQVRFATTLVTKINYRPYTPQSQIAVLYFQEEELEELEWDREMVTGDQFECQLDEMQLAVRIAYQQINPSDE